METKLVKALIEVQKKLKPVEKNQTNPYFKSKYADLQTIWDSCKNVLAENGFAITQVTGIENGLFGLKTMLMHESGETLTGFYVLSPSKPNDPQALGSAITYSRRYALSAMLGIIADSDDDGNAASHGEPPAQTSKVAPRPNSGGFATVSEKQARRLFAIATGAGWTKDGLANELEATWGYKSTEAVSPKDYEAICKAFEAKPIFDE